MVEFIKHTLKIITVTINLLFNFIMITLKEY